MNRNRHILLPLVVMAFLSLPLAAQRVEEKPRLAILEMVNLSGDASLESLAESSMDTLESTLRFMNLYTLRRADYLRSGDQFKMAKPFLLREGYRYAIYGEMEKSASGGYLLRVNIWEAAENEIVLTREAAAESVFDVFDIMDALAIEVVSSFTGQKVAFGLLEVENTGAPGRYAVYVDDQLIGDDVTRQKLLFGEYQVRITVPTGLGEQVVHTETVTIEEGAAVRVSFALADRSEAAEAAALVADDAVDVGRGSLVLTGNPPGAAVTLSGQEAGTLPLDLYGLQAGYHTVRITAPGFYPAQGVVKILPDETVTADYQLTLNLDDPLVKEALYSPAWPSLLSLTYKSAPVLFMLGDPEAYDFGDYFLVPSFSVGYFAAGAPVRGTVFTLLPLITDFTAFQIVGGYTPYRWTPNMIAFFICTLADIAFSPRAAMQANKSIQEQMKKGTYQAREPLKEKGWFLSAGMGGGDFLHAGVGYHFTPHWAYGQEVGWITDLVRGGSRLNQFSTTGKLYYYPFWNRRIDYYSGLMLPLVFNGGVIDVQGGLFSGLAWRVYRGFYMKFEIDLSYSFSRQMGAPQYLLGMEVKL